jgi:alkylation response protein AidB-like acyl-CoA dehydrogenase
MSVMAVQPPAVKPDRAELIARARAIADLVRERARETEAQRRISEDVIERLRRAELFRLMQPARFGGFEYGFDVFADVVTTIARGCGSTGWVYALGASHQWLAALFAPEAQEEFWGDDRDAIGMGSYAPVGQAVAVDGGFRVSGVWMFTSGCDNAQWFFLGGMIPQPEGALKPGFFLAPARDCTIVDNWHTIGLCGTGSKNVVANDLFVPAHRVVTFAELAAGTAPGTRVNPNPVFRQSFLAVLPVTLISPILGMAEAALAEFTDWVLGRTTRGATAGGNRRMAEFATIQGRIGEAAVSIDAARLLMYRDIKEACETVARGESIDLAMRIRNRLDHAFCTRLLVQAIDVLFLATGGQGLFLDNPLQRYWRDAHAAAAHVSLNWDTASTMYGQYVLGLEPKGQY